MPGDGLPPPITKFLRQYVQSVEQLEILLLMRSERHREWTPKAVFEVVRSSERSVSDRLSQFASQGFLACSSSDPASYRYQPGSADLDHMLGATAEAYQMRRVLVLETIFKPGPDPAQSFADAFKFRKS